MMQTIPVRLQRLLRLALLVGVLLVGVLFGGLALSGAFEPTLSEDVAGLFRFAFGILLIGIGLVLGVLRRRRQEAAPAQQGIYAILAWALGESAALFGAVYFLLTGTSYLYLTGLLVFGVAWLLFPILDPAA